MPVLPPPKPTNHTGPDTALVSHGGAIVRLTLAGAHREVGDDEIVYECGSTPLEVSQQFGQPKRL